MRVQPEANPGHNPSARDEPYDQAIQDRSQEHPIVFRQSIQRAAGFQREILERLKDWAEDLLNTQRLSFTTLIGPQAAILQIKIPHEQRPLTYLHYRQEDTCLVINTLLLKQHAPNSAAQLAYAISPRYIDPVSRIPEPTPAVLQALSKAGREAASRTTAPTTGSLRLTAQRQLPASHTSGEMTQAN